MLKIAIKHCCDPFCSANVVLLVPITSTCLLIHCRECYLLLIKSRKQLLVYFLEEKKIVKKGKEMLEGEPSGSSVDNTICINLEAEAEI